MPHIMAIRSLLLASVPTRLCPWSSLAVCSSHASQHGCADPAAGICNNKTRLTEQQPCCLHPFHHDRAVPAAGICNDKTLHIEQDQGNVKVVRNRKGSVNRPVSAKVGAARKRHIRLLSGNLGKEVQGYRPDLKVRTLVPDTGVLSPQRSGTGLALLLGKDGPGYRPGLKARTHLCWHWWAEPAELRHWFPCLSLADRHFLQGETCSRASPWPCH